MHRPLVPRAWRVAVGACGALLLSIPLVGDALGVTPPSLFAIAGISLAVGMIHGSPRDRRTLVIGLGLALLLGLVAQSVPMTLLALGIGIPAALVAARPQPLATSVTALGFGGTLLALSGLAQHPATTFTATGARETILLAVVATLGLGLLLHALLSRSAPADAHPCTSSSRLPDTPALPRRTRLALILVGVAAFALSAALGGRIADIALWPFAIGALVVPALARWRVWPAGALLVGAIALAGAVPAGTCDMHMQRIGIPNDAPPLAQTMTLAQIAGHGPLGGDPGFETTCAPTVLARGAAWALALAGAALIVARRERVEPPLAATHFYA